jgi:hypothetical protein
LYEKRGGNFRVIYRRIGVLECAPQLKKFFHHMRILEDDPNLKEFLRI